MAPSPFRFRKRRRLTSAIGLMLCAILAAPILLTGCGPDRVASSSAPAVRIGIQRGGALVLLMLSGELEKRLAPTGAQVEWIEFQAGPQLLEALNVGSIDFGYVGDSPPIFAQAAGAPLVYVNATNPNWSSSAILVRRDSPLQSLADLKGKRIAFMKGSSSHHLTLKALESVGLDFDDVNPVFLPPADARVAFEQGDIDAWTIWDPLFAVVEQAGNCRVLTTGKGLVQGRSFLIASRAFAEGHPELLRTCIDEIRKTAEWARANPAEAAQRQAPRLGIDPAAIERAERRNTSYGVNEMSPDLIQEQQLVADAYLRQGLIPREIRVQDATISGGK